MYESFYGLKAKPFSMLPDPDFLYLSKKHRVALTMLEYTLMNNAGFCVITGEIGAGKTTLLRKLLSTVEDNITIGMITNTHQSFGELLDWVLSAFGIHQPGLGKVEMHQRFVDFLLEQYAQNKSTLLIVDEAQNMPAATLEELRMLSNINSEKDLVLQVILAGQPDLKDALRKPELMQFAQRISVDFHLDALNSEESCHYIQHRLVTAGATKDIFTPAACTRIAECSGGVPRLINLLCDTALVYGFADQRKVIDVDLIEEVVRERMEHSILPLVKTDNLKATEATNNDNFPWINPEGGTQGLKPAAEKKTIEKAITTTEQSLDHASSEANASKAGESKPDRAEENTRTAAITENFSQQSNKASVVSAATFDVEPTAAVAPLNKKRTMTSSAQSFTASPRPDRSTPIEDQNAPSSEYTEKSKFGNRIMFLGLFVLALFLSLASVALNNEDAVTDRRDTVVAESPTSQDQAESPTSQDQAESQTSQNQAESPTSQDQAESPTSQDQAESAFKHARTEIGVLKQDLTLLQQQIENVQRERDAALAKARLEQEQRETEKQAAAEAANRERVAQAAAALAADKAQQAAKKAEKLALQHRLEKKRLAEQLKRMELAQQQAETQRELLEEQRKLIVLEWERLANEKAKLDMALPDWSDSE
jgi:type II secretory pathway predicted ATPase ExeA